MFGAKNFFGSDSGLLKSLRLSASAMYYCTIALKALLKGCKKLSNFGLGSGQKSLVPGGSGFAVRIAVGNICKNIYLLVQMLYYS